MLTRAQKINRTQWAAQFLGAAELVRIGYVVSFTMGNRTPMADLMVGYQAGEAPFWIDVKGMAGRSGGWFMSPKAELPRLFYILVSVAEDRTSDRFFIMSQAEANMILMDYRAAHPDWNLSHEGFNWTMATPFADRWCILPDYHLLQSN